MNDFNISEKDLQLLNGETAMRLLFREKGKLDIDRALRQARYEARLAELQVELIRMQTWTIENRERLVVLFEGRDAAGKGGAIRRITHRINPRHFRVVALDKPTEDERGQWYFQRYVNQLPRPGEMVFFDRSWYNRAVVEPVNGFCSETEYKIFMGQVNAFEQMITEGGIRLVKLYFSITKGEQARRFKAIEQDPRKRWKMSPVDRKAQELWDEYTKYKEAMFAATNQIEHPWVIIDANRKTTARIQAIEHILSVIPYCDGGAADD